MASDPLPDLRTITSAVDFFWLIHRARDQQVTAIVLQLREDGTAWSQFLYGMALAEHLNRALAGGVVHVDDAGLNSTLDAMKADKAR